jgi:hypothetical protein
MQYTTILYFVLCVCETSSPSFKECYRLRIFENRVLKRIFGPDRERKRGSDKRLEEIAY